MGLIITTKTVQAQVLLRRNGQRCQYGENAWNERTGNKNSMQKEMRTMH